MKQGILGGYRANVKRQTKRGLTNINIKIERAHLVGDKKRSSSRTIVVKLVRNVFLQKQRRANPRVIMLRKILRKPQWKYGKRIGISVYAKTYTTC